MVISVRNLKDKSPTLRSRIEKSRADIFVWQLEKYKIHIDLYLSCCWRFSLSSIVQLIFFTRNKLSASLALNYKKYYTYFLAFPSLCNKISFPSFFVSANNWLLHQQHRGHGGMLFRFRVVFTQTYHSVWLAR